MDLKRAAIKEVRLSELNSNMTIVSYTGFHRIYKQLDKKKCKWLLHNFKNSKIRINRSGRIVKILPKHLQVGDEVLEISNFPDSIRKLTVVNRSLIEALKKRGFHKFKVKIRPKPVPIHQDQQKQNSDNAGRLVESIEKNAKIREQATKAIEEFIDKARNGIVNEKEIKEFVDNMVEQSSPDAMSVITALKQSDQTYAHCVDVSAIYSSVYEKITSLKKEKSIFKDKKELAFAGFVHDLGKANIPKEILESHLNFALDSPEMDVLRSHPVHGAKLLKEIHQPDYILNMTYYHHLKVDPDISSSYPANSENVPILRETRLLSIVDVYQALIGKRPYKKSWPPPSAIRYLDSLAGPEYDLDVWKDFRRVMGEYPIGSLVELSDGSVAYVMSIPEDDLTKPQVVVVQNSAGKFLKRHALLDLSVEQDISIVKDIDAQVHFDDEAMQVFQNIRLN